MKNDQKKIEQWGLFELVLTGPSSGNPFVEVKINATFKCKGIEKEVDGFYDGKGIYRVRYLPDREGTWTYCTKSNCTELEGHTGSFNCVPPSFSNHGPVSVRNTFHFQYADGNSYFPVGTTCYAWVHQGDSLEEQTLESLRESPFNKVRMCVFPKRMEYNENEPLYYPYERDLQGNWDMSRFNPEFFTHFEKRVKDLCDIGIEADIILFHPYDKGHWGFDSMGRENDSFYLNYIISRLASYRNIWWSLANEYDLVKAKTLEDWDYYGQILQEKDPFNHMASVHNWGQSYDYSRSWVTHCSYQTPVTSRGLEEVLGIRARYKKATIIDECLYEGNIELRWGNITPQEMVHRFWLGTVGGCYVTHGETYIHDEDILWWAKGGKLYGQSPERINFLKKILNEGPAQGIEPLEPWRIWRQLTAGRENEYYLLYLSFHQPSFVNLALPEGITFTVDIVDTWNMTVTPTNKNYEGKSIIELPGKPYLALRIQSK